MQETRFKTIVGMFALTCLVVLGIMVVMFGGNQFLLTPTYNLNGRFANGVTGVQTGQSVTLNGKRIGQTTAVEFWDPADVESGIRVVISVDARYAIPEGSRVLVGASIMGFGKPAITIDVRGLSKAAPLPRDGTAELAGAMISTLDQLLPPEMQRTLNGTFQGMQDLAASLRPVADNLNTLLQQRNMDVVDANQAVANISTLVQRFDLTLKNLNVVLADSGNVDNIRVSLANIRQMSETGVTFMKKIDTLSDQGQVLASDATALVRDLRGSVDKLSSALSEFNKAAAAMNDPKGSVGLLLYDNRLYEELVLASRRLSAALDEVRAAMEVAKREGFKVKL